MKPIKTRNEDRMAGFLWSLAVSLGKTPNTVGVCVCMLAFPGGYT